MFRSGIASVLALVILCMASSGNPQKRIPSTDPDPLETNPLDAKALAKAKLALASTKLADLKKAKLEVARGAHDARYKEFMAGRGTLDFMFDASLRLLDSERAVTDKVADVEAACERHWIFTKRVEEVNKDRFEAGRIPIHDYLEAQYYRLQAEIWLVEAREKNKKRE
jgi:hypothetical protein